MEIRRCLAAFLSVYYHPIGAVATRVNTLPLVRLKIRPRLLVADIAVKPTSQQPINFFPIFSQTVVSPLKKHIPEGMFVLKELPRQREGFAGDELSTSGSATRRR